VSYAADFDSVAIGGFLDHWYVFLQSGIGNAFLLQSHWLFAAG
jgi:hypothetical protein